MSSRPTPQDGWQVALLEADWCPELFFGGDRGSGKGWAHCLYQADGATRYGAHYRGIMTRKTYPELEELQEAAREVFGYYGARFYTQPSSERNISNAWYWPNGGITRMRYLEREDDYLRYHGFQFTHVSLDEVTEYAMPDGLLKMISTLRSAHGVPCTLRTSGNPGGIGHQWVKQRYVDVAPPTVPHLDPDSGLERMFIPTPMADNQILLKADPTYRNRLLAATAGNEALRQAWMHGNWDIIAGAFFTGWDRSKHVIAPFAIPAHWVKFRAFDYGYSAPFSLLWFAVSDGEVLPDGRRYPRGALIVYREWYGAEDNRDHVGLQMDAEEIARRAIRLTAEKLDYSVSDPACWQGENHIAHRMAIQGFHAKAGDNARVAGWDQVNARLAGEDGVPMLYITSPCVKLIAHVPMLQRSKIRIEDADSDGLDHDADALRYGCMSFPWARAAPKKVEPLKVGWTFAELKKRNLGRGAAA